MKHYLFLLTFFSLPLLASADAVSNAAPGDPAAASAVVIPTPTPTVNAALAPRISVTHPKFDFGNVEEGPDITHNFRFHNTGKSTLTITNVGTSCGCTAAVMDDKHKSVPPGGFGIIKATYHTSGRPGHATKIITVSSNDPVNPNFQMQLDMTVTREIDIQPDRLYFYNVHFKTPHSASVKILGKPGVHLKILSAETASKVVTVTNMAPITEAAQPALPSPTPGTPGPKDMRHGINLEVNLPESQPIGTFTDEIILKTNSKKKPEVRISVMGEVTGRVQFNPKVFYFAPHQDAPVTIQLTVDPPTGFSIRKVESLKHLVRPYVRKTTTPNGMDQYQLIATVVKDLPKDSDGKDQVVIETNDKDQPTITIDVQAGK